MGWAHALGLLLLAGFAAGLLAFWSRWRRDARVHGNPLGWLVVALLKVHAGVWLCGVAGLLVLAWAERRFHPFGVLAVLLLPAALLASWSWWRGVRDSSRILRGLEPEETVDETASSYVARPLDNRSARGVAELGLVTPPSIDAGEAAPAGDELTDRYARAAQEMKVGLVAGVLCFLGFLGLWSWVQDEARSRAEGMGGIIFLIPAGLLLLMAASGVLVAALGLARMFRLQARIRRLADGSDPRAEG